MNRKIFVLSIFLLSLSLGFDSPDSLVGCVKKEFGCAPDNDVAGWQEIGEGSASGGGISDSSGFSQYPVLAINNSDSPVIAWQDNTSGNWEIYIKQWNGNSWEEIGTNSASGGGISNTITASENPSLGIDGSGYPIVSWAEEVSTFSITGSDIYVKKWNGSNWEEIGIGSASEDGISKSSTVFSRSSSLAINNSGNPVVVWKEASYLYLKQWNGNTWEELDVSATGKGISGTRLFSGYIHLGTEINSSGYPIIAWQCINSEENCEIYLKQWNGTSWEELGGSASGGGISNISAESIWPSIAINGSGNPIVVWTNFFYVSASAGNYKIYIKQWNGTGWEEMGAGSASEDGISDFVNESNYPSLATNNNGYPIVAWSGGVTMDIYIQQWNGTNWEELGEGSASGGGISNNYNSSGKPSLAVTDSGNPMVAWYNSTSDNYEIYIKQYIPTE